MPPLHGCTQKTVIYLRFHSSSFCIFLKWMILRPTKLACVQRLNMTRNADQSESLSVNMIMHYIAKSVHCNSAPRNNQTKRHPERMHCTRSNKNVHVTARKESVLMKYVQCSISFFLTKLPVCANAPAVLPLCCLQKTRLLSPWGLKT